MGSGPTGAQSCSRYERPNANCVRNGIRIGAIIAGVGDRCPSGVRAGLVPNNDATKMEDVVRRHWLAISGFLDRGVRARFFVLCHKFAAQAQSAQTLKTT